MNENSGTAPRRREAIRRLLQERTVRSQTELGRLLRAEGLDAAQPTLSRDIHELGLVKGPEGYQLPGASPAPASPEGESSVAGRRLENVLRLIRRYVLSVEPAGSLVVLRTPPPTRSRWRWPSTAAPSRASSGRSPATTPSSWPPAPRRRPARSLAASASRSVRRGRPGRPASRPAVRRGAAAAPRDTAARPRCRRSRHFSPCSSCPSRAQRAMPKVFEGADTEMKNVRRIALAYSGGLDTSIIIPWLREVRLRGRGRRGRRRAGRGNLRPRGEGAPHRRRRLPPARSARGVRSRLPLPDPPRRADLRAASICSAPPRRGRSSRASRSRSPSRRAATRWRTAAPARATIRFASSSPTRRSRPSSP